MSREERTSPPGSTSRGNIITVNAARLTFASDLDGVGYDFNATMRAWFVNHRGMNAADLPDATTYSLATCWNMDQDELVAEMVAAFRAGVLFHTGAAYADAVAGCRAVQAAGHRLIFVTARNLPGIESETEAVTRKWLALNGFDADDVIVTSDKNAVGWDLLLDDSASNIDVALAGGRNGLLLGRDFNADVTHLPRVNWADVPLALEAIALGKSVLAQA